MYHMNKEELERALKDWEQTARSYYINVEIAEIAIKAIKEKLANWSDTQEEQTESLEQKSQL